MKDRRLPQYRQVEFLVETTSYEHTRLALDWRDKIETWEDVHLDDGPYPKRIGKLDGRPIEIWFWWAKLNGHLVGFYEPTSEVIDYAQLEAWLDKNCLPPVYGADGIVHRVDAQNFKNCLVSLGIRWKPFT